MIPHSDASRQEDLLRWGVVILAAGQGTRMRSSLPKVLHRVAGKCLVDHVLDQAATAALPADTTVVVGHGADQVTAQVAKRGVATVLQEPQLGTGHALQIGLEAHTARCQPDADAIIVLSGDVPLLRPATILSLRSQLEDGAEAVMLTAVLDDPGSYGRVLRSDDTSVRAVVEARDASPETLSCSEVNAGIYAFRVPSLTAALAGLDADNAQQEYYLTDVVAALTAQHLPVAAVTLAEPDEMSGVNTRADLARVAEIANRRILDGLMERGITIVDPGTTWVEADCQIEADVVIEPGVVIRSGCRIGAGATIGANAVCEGVEIPPDQIVPPLTHLV